jgi:hypothetical protein
METFKKGIGLGVSSSCYQPPSRRGVIARIALPVCSIVYPSLRLLIARSLNILLFSAAQLILSRSISVFNPLPRGWGVGVEAGDGLDVVEGVQR